MFLKRKREFFLFLFLPVFFIFLPNSLYAQATNENCSPWNCECDSPSDRCIRNHFGSYTCQIAKEIGGDCQPKILGLGCDECGPGLECRRAGFGVYICAPPDANLDQYFCNPWTGKPCSNEERCVQISWGHYECRNPKKEGEDCLPPPSLNECGPGLECRQTSFGKYECLSSFRDVCQGNEECKKCFKTKKDGGVYENGGAWTTLGCIPTEPMDLVKWLFPYLLGFGGLAAFGLIVYSGFRLMTSSGDPQKIQGAKETITAAVTGLIFIILSLFLLRLIGVDILGLPGLE